jgi:hypothetical protein
MILKLTKNYLKNKEKSKLPSQGVNISSQAPTLICVFLLLL